MSSVFADPDIKINMSLDEIIQLTRAHVGGRLQSRCLKILRKRKMYHGKRFDISSNHSVPLLGSDTGVDIYVSKKSPLLTPENRRRIAQAVSNRVINSSLLEKSKQIIPAEYKLVKTTHGVERILVPSTDYLKSNVKNLEPPRKLLKDSNVMNSKTSSVKSFREKPPPLVTAPIFSPPKKSVDETLMEVDTEDDVIILETTECKKSGEVIDVESNLPVDVLQAKKLCLPSTDTILSSGVKTLNDRFTMLTGNFKF